jgi:8-oxo-dGTP pyrophosphatase MutT (NUDIX family)
MCGRAPTTQSGIRDGVDGPTRSTGLGEGIDGPIRTYETRTAVDEARAALAATVEAYLPDGDVESDDLGRIVRLVESVADPWSRSQPVHLTASAIVVHVASDRVLLRWHAKFQRFMQVGGHGDPGEWDPLAIALREASEETGLRDLQPIERAGRRVASELIHVAVRPVPAYGEEPAHEHADLRFLLETHLPEDAQPETPTAPIRWMSWDEAIEVVENENLRVLLERARAAVHAGPPARSTPARPDRESQFPAT